MATLATHLAIGVLLGAAMGLRWRILVLAAILAELPDLDHFAPFTARVTFHNVFFCIVAPVVLAWPVAYRWRDRLAPDIVHLLWAAPLLVSSHLFLDMLPAATEISSNSVALWYPVGAERYHLTPDAGYGVDPTSLSTFTYLAIALVALAGAGRLLAARFPPRILWTLRPAIPLALLLMFPAMAAGGLMSQVTSHPLTELRISEPTVTIPQGTAELTILAQRGADAPPGSLRVSIRVGDLVRNETNRAWVSPETPWRLFVTMAIPADYNGTPAVSLKAWDGHEYGNATAVLVRSHVDANITFLGLTRARTGNLTASFRVEGERSIPTGAARVTLVPDDGTAPLTLTNAGALAPGKTWNATLPANNATTFDTRLFAVTDGHVYVDARGVIPRT